jgi:hypothetical protein
VRRVRHLLDQERARRRHARLGAAFERPPLFPEVRGVRQARHEITVVDLDDHALPGRGGGRVHLVGVPGGDARLRRERRAGGTRDGGGDHPVGALDRPVALQPASLGFRHVLRTSTESSCSPRGSVRAHPRGPVTGHRSSGTVRAAWSSPSPRHAAAPVGAAPDALCGVWRAVVGSVPLPADGHDAGRPRRPDAAGAALYPAGLSAVPPAVPPGGGTQLGAALWHGVEDRPQ